MPCTSASIKCAGQPWACPGHPRLAGLAPKKDVGARDTSAFTRVFDALCAGMTTERLAQLQL